ncbi:hypothetical protein AB9Q04_01085 [Anaerococcus sp. ENR1011]|uniref:Uncharacterized protein n=1 Tax=Anaerococcus groningensis TaxID=3115616 RepID=A0ABW9MYR3_9FIRM
MKKLATLALAILVLPSAHSLAASENNQMNNHAKSEITSESKDEKQSQTDLYEVTEVFEGNVTLKFVQTLTGDIIPTYNGAEFNVPKDKFADKEIKVGDRYKIKHDDIIMPSNPAQFGKIYSIEKDDQAEVTDDEIKEEKIKDHFVVEKVNEDGYTIADIENNDNKYIISKKDAKNMDLVVGDELEITHNGVVMESYPAQFGKIFKVVKYDKQVEDESKEEKVTENFIVEEVADGGYTIYKKSNKDSKYSISKEDVTGINLNVGDELEITHTGLATRSIPAQFVGDVEIKKIDNSKTPVENKISDARKQNDIKDITRSNNSNEEKDQNLKSNNLVNNSMKDRIGGANPKTGILSSMGVLGTAGTASLLAKKTKKY